MLGLPHIAMNFCPIVISGLISLAVPAYGNDTTPERLLEDLGAEAFKEREAAQLDLIKWAEKNGIRPIYERYLHSDDPEIRKRCHEILRTWSDRDYLSDGQGYMGLQMREEMSRINGDDRLRACLRIVSVVPKGPADVAELKVGDLIVSMDDETWYEAGMMDGVIRKIASYKPLRKVSLKIQREGQKHVLDIPLVLGKRPVPDLRIMSSEAVQELDQQAREKHFEEWIKKQEVEKQ